MADSDGLAYRDRRRALIDRLTRRIVVGSGWLVLLALLLIFFYLLYVVIPLFSQASVRQLAPVAVDMREPALALGISDNGRWAFRVDAAGYGEFIALERGQAVARAPLAKAVTLAAMSVGERPLLVLGQADGALSVVRPELPLSGVSTPQWRHPLGEQPLQLVGAVQPLRQLAVTESDAVPIVAIIDGDNQLQLYTLTTVGAQSVSQVTLTEPVEQLVLTPDGQQLYTLNGHRLTVWRLREQVLTARETVVLPGAAPLSLSLLAGGHSLLVKSADGDISQWSDIPTTVGPRLSELRTFPIHGRQLQLVTEPRRRVFATLDPQGNFSLFASKQSDELISTSLVPQARLAVFSPLGRALLVETDSGLQPYQLDNAYPDVGWRGLWQQLWYESYPAADYVWQPTAADDSYQAKFSLVPLLVGTFKAALYAMLFAAPLALAAAIYTACFMTPTLRRWIKPAMEIMGALPTVVIGLIAALWLAPHMATYLAAILLLPPLWGLAVLGCGWSLEQLPARWRRGVSAGWDALLLIPAMLLMLALACWLGPWLELRLLGQPLWQWMGDHFSQRNTLVAGVALGFALIPLIFSLAEDALFSVPTRLSQGSLALGATAWQTLWRVVLPSASSGIFAALMLSFGRAVGETMIVLMATGNTPVMDNSLFQGLRSLAANIAIEMPEAAMSSAHYRVLFLAALVLFMFTFVVNSLAEVIRQRLRRRYRDEGDLS
ncbi:ABC transporter permease subunit [Dickeya poaceiphila]|uniref:ABC transporter permease subunit n=1 Tax=Dickeya poaceiphila TaxID=568768 RepID=A0A5B8I232_9GAMM|nr:ABC transporter permease subunit [Dickeya poaceiphila]QDX29272.1 ABC transporter permease subunit [Dickeya poaceiphila]